MSVKERKKGKSVWSLLFGFSEEFEDTKNVLSDEAYNKELEEALAKIEKMEKRFDVPSDKVKKDKKNQAKQHIVKEPLNQIQKEKDQQKQKKEQEKERE